MTEICVLALLALTAALTAGVLIATRRMLRLVERMEATLSAMRPAAREAKRSRADAEQERYERGVANILAYGTRELMRKGGEAQ